MSTQLNYTRRLLIAAISMLMMVSAQAQTDTTNPFDHIKQIKAGVLNVGYAEFGPADGPVVSYEQVALGMKDFIAQHIETT